MAASGHAAPVRRTLKAVTRLGDSHWGSRPGSGPRELRPMCYHPHARARRPSRTAWVLISSASSRRTADKLVADTKTRLAGAQSPARNPVMAFLI